MVWSKAVLVHLIQQPMREVAVAAVAEDIGGISIGSMRWISGVGRGVGISSSVTLK